MGHQESETTLSRGDTMNFRFGAFACAVIAAGPRAVDRAQTRQIQKNWSRTTMRPTVSLAFFPRLQLKGAQAASRTCNLKM